MSRPFPSGSRYASAGFFIDIGRSSTGAMISAAIALAERSDKAAVGIAKLGLVDPHDAVRELRIAGVHRPYVALDARQHRPVLS